MESTTKPDQYGHIDAVFEDKTLRGAYYTFLLESTVLAVLTLGIVFALAAYLGKTTLASLPVLLTVVTVAEIYWLQKKKRQAHESNPSDSVRLYAAYAMEASAFGELSVGLFCSLYTLSVLYGGETKVPTFLMQALVVPIAFILCAYPCIAAGGWREMVRRKRAYTSTRPQSFSARLVWRGMWLTIAEICCVNTIFLFGLLMAGLTMR